MPNCKNCEKEVDELTEEGLCKECAKVKKIWENMILDLQDE